ncbi:MAG: DUF1398 family protein [Terriglobales bacterium]
MSLAIEKLQAGLQKAMSNRPKVGGFPYLAECLRQAGAQRNIWVLPAAQATYVLDDGIVVEQGTPLINGVADVPGFDRDRLIAALRTDQAGNSTFPEFLQASWQAGVVRYDVDFSRRTVTYYGAHDEHYEEAYPEVAA